MGNTSRQDGQEAHPVDWRSNGFPSCYSKIALYMLDGCDVRMSMWEVLALEGERGAKGCVTWFVCSV